MVIYNAISKKCSNGAIHTEYSVFVCGIEQNPKDYKPTLQEITKFNKTLMKSKRAKRLETKVIIPD